MKSHPYVWCAAGAVALIVGGLAVGTYCGVRSTTAGYTEGRGTITTTSNLWGTPLWQEANVTETRERSGRPHAVYRFRGYGPLSESGERHGRWASFLWELGVPKGTGERSSVWTWYWYGEEVAEGEWRLRNK